MLLGAFYRRLEIVMLLKKSRLARLLIAPPSIKTAVTPAHPVKIGPACLQPKSSPAAAPDIRVALAAV
jgi:hypothetical protein